MKREYKSAWGGGKTHPIHFLLTVKPTSHPIFLVQENLYLWLNCIRTEVNYHLVLTGNKGCFSPCENLLNNNLSLNVISRHADSSKFNAPRHSLLQNKFHFTNCKIQQTQESFLLNAPKFRWNTSTRSKPHLPNQSSGSVTIEKNNEQLCYDCWRDPKVSD